MSPVLGKLCWLVTWILLSTSSLTLHQSLRLEETTVPAVFFFFFFNLQEAKVTILDPLNLDPRFIQMSKLINHRTPFSVKFE